MSHRLWEHSPPNSTSPPPPFSSLSGIVVRAKPAVGRPIHLKLISFIFRPSVLGALPLSLPRGPQVGRDQPAVTSPPLPNSSTRSSNADPPPAVLAFFPEDLKAVVPVVARHSFGETSVVSVLSFSCSQPAPSAPARHGRCFTKCRRL